jgi:hypothetical protein
MKGVRSILRHLLGRIPKLLQLFRGRGKAQTRPLQTFVSYLNYQDLLCSNEEKHEIYTKSCIQRKL